MYVRIVSVEVHYLGIGVCFASIVHDFTKELVVPHTYPIDLCDATEGVVVDWRGEAPGNRHVEREAALQELGLDDKVPGHPS